jgi:hypothetical protein
VCVCVCVCLCVRVHAAVQVRARARARSRACLRVACDYECGCVCTYACTEGGRGDISKQCAQPAELIGAPEHRRPYLRDRIRTPNRRSAKPQQAKPFRWPMSRSVAVEHTTEIPSSESAPARRRAVLLCGRHAVRRRPLPCSHPSPSEHRCHTPMGVHACSVGGEGTRVSCGSVVTDTFVTLERFTAVMDDRMMSTSASSAGTKQSSSIDRTNASGRPVQSLRASGSVVVFSVITNRHPRRPGQWRAFAAHQARMRRQPRHGMAGADSSVCSTHACPTGTGPRRVPSCENADRQRTTYRPRAVSVRYPTILLR